MIDLQDKKCCPSIEAIGEYVRNPVFLQFCSEIFTVMTVIGTQEKALVETILPDCTVTLQKLYHQTQEGNGQRWLMLDLENQDGLYQDTLRIIQIRRNS